MDILQINKLDNVAVALKDLAKGDIVSVNDFTVTVQEDIPSGHKIALKNIAAGENIIKYSFPIGHANGAIAPGSHVHTHNLKTNLGSILSYEYNPVAPVALPVSNKTTFMGYKRENGTVGTRNNLWIVPTVNCVTSTVRYLEKIGRELIKNYANIDDCMGIVHPYGCSQIGTDYTMTQKILADIVNHPNAGAVLVVSLGCENNNLTEFKKVLGDYNPDRVKFMVTQEVEDEDITGRHLLEELAEFANRYKRKQCPVSDLRIGLKCGGSDGFSGITANPLIGELSDLVIGSGGTTVLTEVPEMFGAETLLMNRAKNEETFHKTVDLINNFKAYFKRYNQPISDNPSPGNKKGGITTLEDKSLGCVQKGGHAQVVDVLSYGDTVQTAGLQLLNGPGNDSVSTTALAASGCQIILFSTGRGTPWGTIVPTVKIATNSRLAYYKAKWIDFNAGRLLDGTVMEKLRDDLWETILEIASGRQTKAEQMNFNEIAVWKDGVTE
ncbi:UxaA family hydrolase [Megamonas hypermegale]|uniref:UxaA family hydrolase n=1 Tax=Megamonas hypermegale TaxID=158847 RepID=UPI0026EFB0EA|nr:altronate dehydratase family protein [Megamonas hypermegale]